MTRGEMIAPSVRCGFMHGVFIAAGAFLFTRDADMSAAGGVAAFVGTTAYLTTFFLLSPKRQVYR